MIFHITETPIDTATARLALCQPQSGGYVSFEGWVRDHHAGKAVSHLIYSAYLGMAEREGARIIRDAKAQFDIDAAACMHRIGALQIGELAVWSALPPDTAAMPLLPAATSSTASKKPSPSGKTSITATAVAPGC